MGQVVALSSALGIVKFAISSLSSDKWEPKLEYKQADAMDLSICKVLVSSFWREAISIRAISVRLLPFSFAIHEKPTSQNYTLGPCPLRRPSVGKIPSLLLSTAPEIIAPIQEVVGNRGREWEREIRHLSLIL